MICPKCGFELREGLTFCPKCLEELGNVNHWRDTSNIENDNSNIYPPQEVILDDVPLGNSEEVYDNNVKYYVPPQILKKKFYQKTWFIVLTLVIFCPVGLFLMWKYAEWNKPLKIGVTVAIGLLFVYSSFTQKVNENQVIDTYNTAVDYIMDENYSDAETTLNEIVDSSEGVDGAKDVKVLIQYANLQDSISSYRGKPDSFLQKLNEINGINNSRVNEQKSMAIEQTSKASDIQSDINSIELESVSLDAKEKVTDIAGSISDLSKRYVSLIDDTNLEKAEKTLTHLEKNDEVGKLIIAIAELDNVTLDSEHAITEARKNYDLLSDGEKEEVVNYASLKKAETKLSSLQNEERLAKEKAAEEKAEQERQAEEKAKEEAESTVGPRSMTEGDTSGYTVYITNSGLKYHASGCPSLKSKIPIDVNDAIAQGYEPCGRCHP